MGVGAGLYMCDVVKKVHVRYLISWWVLVLGLHTYQVSSWSMQRFDHNRRGPKFGWGSAPFEDGMGPHLTQSRLSWGLPPYQVASWCIQPFGHNKDGHKIGGSVPFLGRAAVSPSSPMWNGPRLTSMPSAILINTLVSTDICGEFYGDHPRGIPTSGELNTRGVALNTDSKWSGD